MRNTLILIICCLSLINYSYAQIITTVAGNGTSGYSGDGGAATSAEITPWTVASDHAGGFFIGAAATCSSCSNPARVRRVNSAGIINTYAGTGTIGFSGDGGAATAAKISRATIASDAAGNLYIGDWANYRIRKVNTSGIITTIAGNGSPGYTGDGGPATAAAIGFYVYGGFDDNGMASDPYGNIYFYSFGYSKIRKIDTSGIISTIAGDGYFGFSGDGGPATSAEFSNIYSICADGLGNVYLGDWDNGRVRKIDTSGIITTVAGSGGSGFFGDGGPATDAGILPSCGLATDVLGNLYICNDYFHRVRKVNSAGIISTLAGTGAAGFSGDGGPSTAAILYSPFGIATDIYENLYICDDGNNRIRKIKMYARSPLFIGGDTMSFTICENSGSYSLDTILTVYDSTISYTATYNLSTGPLHGIATVTYSVITTGGILLPTGLSYTPSAGYYGKDSFRVRVTDGIYSDSTTIVVNITRFDAGFITGPAIVCPGNSITLTDTTSGGVWSSSNIGIATVGSTGVVTGTGAGSAVISYTVTGSCGSVTAQYPVMVGVPVITTVAGNGTSGCCIGDGGPATAAELGYPTGVFADGSGNIYVANQAYNRIRKVDSAGIITTIAGTGTSGFSGDGGPATNAMIYGPTAITKDVAGNIYFSDAENVRIRKINTSGIISTIAGTGITGFLGDGGPSTAAQIHEPFGIATDLYGNLYFTDYNRIRKINSSGIISTVAGSAIGLSGFSGDGGPATAALLNGISRIQTDVYGNLYISDFGNYRIRMVNTSGIIKTVAGNGISGSTGDGGPATAAELYSPEGLVIDAGGNLYVAGYIDQKVRVVNNSGIIKTYAGIGSFGYTGDDGPATSATFAYPLDVSFTGPNNLYIADNDNSAIRKVSPGTVVTSALTGLAKVCVGSTITFSDSTTGGIWSSSNTAVAAVGTTGIVTGISAGTATITYSVTFECGVLFSTKTVSVNPVPGIPVGPTAVCAGSTIALSDIGGGTWVSSNSSVASVALLTGIVTGITGGIAIITYAIPSGCYAIYPVTVNQTPAAISGLTNICYGISTTLSDTLTGGTWSSSDPYIAPIAATSGVYTGATPGIATITYSMSTGCSTTTTVTINTVPAPITGITSVCVGLSTSLSDAVPGGSWSPATGGIATASPTGVITGVSPGTPTIFYTLPDGCAVSTTVTVNNTAGAIAGPSQVCVNGTATFTDPTGGGTWTSSSTAIATIGSASGILTGLLSGTVTVTYSIGAGCSATKVITVNPLPAPISGTPVVCVGSATTLSDPTPGGVWSSTVVANGSISTSGVLTGIAAGNTVIDYTLPATGCSRAVTATVNPQPAVISGPSVVCQGATITLSDATAGGSWSAGTGTISLGTGTGIVLGVLAGTAAVTYALSTGCARTKVITVNPLPSAISGPASLCQGATAILTDAGGGVWSTISSPATIGSLTGLVSGVSGGTALITYTLSTGCSVTRTETINPLPMPISGPGALCPGTTMTLTDAGGGTWSSMTPAVASIGTSTGVVSGLITGTTTVTYTLPTGCTTSKAVTVSTTPTAIAGSSTVCLGGTTTLTDTVTGGSWFSAIPTTASIGTLSGIVTGSATGVTTITYSLGTGCTVTKTITVVPSPAAITGSSSICISGTTPMTDATTGGIWSAGTGSVSVSSTGVVTGVAAGVATIDYTVAGCTATKGITVNATPTPISGSGSVCAGATITESDGTGGGVWSASGTAISVGAGSGLVTGSVAGSGTLTYSIGSCSVSRIISVNPVPTLSGATGICTGTTSTLTASITGGTWYSSAGCVSAGSATGIITGVSPGTATITYTLATGCSASVAVTVNGAPGAITGTLHVCAGAATALSDGTGGGIWSIAPATVASIGSSSGIVSGNLPGTATVTYSLGSGCTKTAIVTVNAVPAAITGTAQVCAGLTTTLSDATTGGIWSAGPGSVSVSGAGVVTGIATGTATIAYTVSGCSATVPFTVNPLPSAIAGTSSLCAGLSTPFTDITSGGTWSTGSGIAGVGSGSGMVNGISAGTAIISYTLPTGCMATKTIIINSAPLTISGGTMVCVGSALALTDGTSGGIWSSANMAVGSIGTTGVVTGISTGTTVISYTIGGCPAMKTVTVNSLPGPISGPAIVCISATVTATDAGGGLWSSSNPVIATISTSSGIISGVAAGTATITYSLGAGCTVTEMITVNPLPASITASTSNVCSGATLALSDATPGGAWGSGSPGVATVGTTGLVTGGTAGISIITYTAPSGCMATRSITVISVAPISGVHNICAYGDTMTVSNVPGTGLYTSSLATVANLGGGLGRVTGNTPGIASVTYILPVGCIGTAWFTVNPLPAAISGSGSLCVGSTAALTDATPGGTWSAGAGIVSVGSGSGVVTGITGGTGYVTYTLTSTGCKVDTSEIAYSLPAAITGPASLFLGTPVTLSDAVTGGLWSSSNTLVATVVAGTGHVTGISVGVVTITYATGGICPVTKHLTVMPSAGRSGPAEVAQGATERGNAVRVSPNPGDGGFTIDLTWATEETVHITISNVAGMKIKEWSMVTVKDGVVSMPVQIDVASGVYLLSVDGNDYKYVTRVVVER